MFGTDSCGFKQYLSNEDIITAEFDDLFVISLAGPTLSLIILSKRVMGCTNFSRFDAVFWILIDDILRGFE